MADDDSNDSMPPLDYVGASTSQTEGPLTSSASTPKAEGTAPAANGDQASDDSMPPLEFVGTSETPCREGLRPGDKVVLEGLSTASLNGQRGTILPFTDAAVARKGRLGVRLDNGKQMSVKRENLRKVSTPAREPNDGGESDDSMPPLDYVGSSPQPVETKAPAAKETAESDDSMPPLDFVGTSVRASPSTPAAPAKVDTANDDDDMPPLADARTAPKVEVKREKPPEKDDDSDDSMPPLDYVGAAPKAHVKPDRSHEEDGVSDDSMPPLDYVGTAPKADVKLDRPLEKEEESDDSMPPLDYVGAASKAEVKPKKPSEKDDASDDSMPPLDYVGAAPKADVKLKKPPEKDDTSDDSMPPLDYVGAAPKAEVELEKPPEKDDASDDSMPPLDYVGAAPKADVKLEKPPEKDDASDDSMPPLDYVGTAPKADAQPHRPPDKKEESEDSMPPLDYVGAAPKVDAKIERPLDKEESEDSMPPLDYVGPPQAASQAQSSSTAAPAVAKTAAAPAAKAPAAAPAAPAKPKPCAEVLDDSMPALEYVGYGDPEHLRESLRPGDKVILKGLSTTSLNGQTAAVLPFTDDAITKKGRLAIRLDTGKEMAVKRENLQKVAVQKDCVESEDDDMPPLDYVGTAPKSDVKGDAADEDDDMPPLEYVGTAPKSDVKGDAVDEDDDDMPPLEYVGAAPKSDVKVDAADEDDDDMPPLEYVGTAPKSDVKVDAAASAVDPAAKSAQPTQAAKAAQATEAADESDDSMPPLDYVGSAPNTGSSKSTLPVEQPQQDAESDDSMPPLDYVGSAPAKTNHNVDQAKEDVASDDSMPPLDYVGVGSKPPEKKAAPKVPQSFQPGDQVVLQGLSTVALNGQKGTVVPTAGAQNGRLGVRLQDGKVLSIKHENLQEKGAPTKVSAPSKDDEASDDSMPPLDYVGSAMPSQGGGKDAAESDDSMPPLDYVGNAPPRGSVPAGPAEPAAESDDSMPPLDYVGSAPPKGQGSEAKQEAPTTKMPAPASKPRPPAVAVGDVVVLSGLTNAAFNGQRAVVLGQADTAESRITVKLEKSGQKLAVKLDKVEKAARVAQVKEETESFDDMPPLEYVGSEVPQRSVGKPVEKSSAEAKPAASAMEEQAASDDSMPPLDYVGNAAPQVSQSPAAVTTSTAAGDDAASDDSMPPLDYVGSSVPQVEKTSISPETAEPVKDGTASDDSMPPLEYTGKSVPQAVESDDSMPPLDYMGDKQKQEGTHTQADDDADSHDSMPPLEYTGAAAAPASTAKASPVKASESASQQGRVLTIPGLTAPKQGSRGKPSAGSPSHGGSGDGFSTGSTVVLKGFKTGDLNGQRVTIVPRTKLTPKGKLEVELKNGKRMAVSFRQVDKLPDQGRAVVDSQIDNDPPASDDSLPPLEDDAAQQILKVGDIVMLQGLAKSELNGQHATVVSDASKEGDGRLRVKLIGSGAKLAVLKEKVERVKAAPTAPAAATAKTPSTAPAIATSPKSEAAPKKDSAPAEGKELANAAATQRGSDRSKLATSRKVTAEGLLEKMKEAMQGSSENLILSVIDEVEANKELNFGDLLPKKKQLLKKLRAKKRKLDGDTSCKVESEVSAAEYSSPAATMKIFKESQVFPEVRGSASEVSDDSKEKPWMVLTPSMQEKAGVPIKEWCQKLELPPEVLTRLEEEEVKTPDELVHVPEEDLKAIVANLKIGPKGRFLAAVKALR